MNPDIIMKCILAFDSHILKVDYCIEDKKFHVYIITFFNTEWPKKMCTLFTHQYLWNKFK